MVRRRLLVLALAAGVIVVDQLSKWWVLDRLADGDVIDLVGSLRLALAFNKGTAFSFGSGSGVGAWLAVGAFVVVLVVVGRSPIVSTRWGGVAFGLILGGAVGNIIDRASRGDAGPMSGAVVDFIDLQWWPVFNIADAAIVCGAILLLVGLLLWSDKDDHEAGTDDPGVSGTLSDKGAS